MKVVIGVTPTPLPEVVRLGEYLRQKGVEVVFTEPICSLDELSPDYWDKYKDADLIYYRNGLGDALRLEFGKKVDGEAILINKIGIQDSLIYNKLYQAIQVKSAGLRIPETLPTRKNFDLAKERLGLPFIFKAANGMKGEKVYLINSEGEYKAASAQLNGETLRQKFIPNSGDFRVIVMGGEVYAMFKRIPASGDFKANISQGGNGEMVEDTELRKRLSEFALKIAEAMKLDFTGIDIILSEEDGELYFIEANVNPAWAGLEKTLGLHMSEAVADWFIELIEEKQNN